jgi:hypothetical protein
MKIREMYTTDQARCIAFAMLAQSFLAARATECVIDGNRIDLITVTASAPTAESFWAYGVGDDGVSNVVANGERHYSLDALVDGNSSAGDSGYFRSMEDNVYLEFEFNTPTLFTQVTAILQHHLYDCTFEWSGINSNGDKVVIPSYSEFVGGPHKDLFEYSSAIPSDSEAVAQWNMLLNNDVAYNKYRLTKATGTCKSPIWQEVNFPGALCITPAPSATPTYKPTVATPVPTTPTPTIEPTSEPTPSPLKRNCAIDLPTGVEGCNNELVHSASCSVSCRRGYEPSNAGTTKFSCVDGTLTETASLRCKGAGCFLPGAFEAGVRSSSVDANKQEPPGPSCQTGGILKDGEFCYVECRDEYNDAGGGNRYSCTANVLEYGGLTCTEKPCVVPDLQKSNFVGVSGFDPSGAVIVACLSNQTLLSGQKCGAGCARGYALDRSSIAPDTPSMDTVFQCSKGTVTATSDVTCLPAACPFEFQLLGPGVQRTSTCNGKQYLEHGEECKVKCQQGWAATDISAKDDVFGCSKGRTQFAGLACKEAPCTIRFPQSMEGDGPGGCVNGQTLSSGSSCAVKCKAGYREYPGTRIHTCKTGTYTPATMACGADCRVPMQFPPGVDSAETNSCTPGLQLRGGEKCSIKCADGFTDASNGVAEYQCSEDYSEFSQATIKCIPDQKCEVPKNLGETAETLGYGMARSAMMVSCTPGQMLGPYEQCFVECSEGFEYAGGTTTYGCNAGTLVAEPSMKCRPLSCSVPDLEPLSIATPPEYYDVVEQRLLANDGTGLPGCKSGMTLGSSEACSFMCGADTSSLNGQPTRIQCKTGKLTFSTECITKSCVLPANLGNFTDPDPPYRFCRAGSTLKSGSFCEMKCMTGASLTNDEGTYNKNAVVTTTPAIWQCQDGVLTSPPAHLRCKPDACRMPTVDEMLFNGLAYDITEPLEGKCEPNTFLQSGTQCGIKCAPGLSWKRGQSNLYRCEFGELVQSPDLHCESDVCPYARDLSCFDWRYPCSDCCTTGVNPEGKDCWTAFSGFDQFQCCSQYEPPAAPLQFAETPPAPRPDSCMRDPTCFDRQYDCQSCCASGFGLGGHACWNEEYTATRCCSTATQQAEFFGAQQQQQQNPDMPSFECAREPACFDATYPCELCCSTGFNHFNAWCFDTKGPYTAEKCCRTPSQESSSSNVQFYSITSRTNQIPMDSRGNPTVPVRTAAVPRPPVIMADDSFQVQATIIGVVGAVVIGSVLLAVKKRSTSLKMQVHPVNAHSLATGMASAAQGQNNAELLTEQADRKRHPSYQVSQVLK